MKTQALTPNLSTKQKKLYGQFMYDLAEFALTEVNPDDQAIERLFGHKEELQKYMVIYIRRFSAQQTDYTQARNLLGADFITPEEIMKTRSGVIYNDEDLDFLAETMPDEKALQWCKASGYFVMPAPPDPIALLSVRTLNPNLFCSEIGGWYADKKFASSDKTRRGWLAVHKKCVSNSTSKVWDRRNEALSGIEEVLNAAEMAWFITTYFKVRGIRLFENIYVRTSSIVSLGDHVQVGHFDQRGLSIVY